MIIDSSALIAILLDEPEAALFAQALLSSSVNRISAANYLEAAIVVDRRAQENSRIAAFEPLVEAARLQIVDVTPARVVEARKAYRRYGKGFDPARLNFGDSFAYALAVEFNEPLLFKGNDFAQTDVIRAV
ncbi:Ribonuclease VapC [Brevundimonas subvibrioides]|uniref:type II toxin-antitoxin system VapC family toxin n=1 Tax=Brevundimonas subvibrioides TaxID=74313 RepID=UPI0032D5A1A6